MNALQNRSEAIVVIDCEEIEILEDHQRYLARCLRALQQLVDSSSHPSLADAFLRRSEIAIKAAI